MSTARERLFALPDLQVRSTLQITKAFLFSRGFLAATSGLHGDLATRALQWAAEGRGRGALEARAAQLWNAAAFNLRAVASKCFKIAVFQVPSPFYPMAQDLGSSVVRRSPCLDKSFVSICRTVQN